MQALMDFKRDTMEAMVANEDMQEEIKDMLKSFHSNLLVLQQVLEVRQQSSSMRSIVYKCVHMFI
jgi:hypothetical protein